MPARVPTYRRATAWQADSARDRKADKRFYAGTKWRACRAAQLMRSPLCERCLARGETVEATEVHHKWDRKDAPWLAYDEGNLESLCKPCHSRITAAEHRRTTDTATGP